MSRVDVIVPCYKYAHYLRECVESILSQSLTDVRVLIIDDASPDHTPEVAAELAARVKRVEYRRHSVNRGHIATFNEGLEWTTSDYTLLISADDVLTPGASSRAVRLMDAHPEVGFVCGPDIHFKPGESRPQPRTVSEECEWQIWDSFDWLEAVFKGDCDKLPVSAPTAIVRTRLQRELGGYREELPCNHDYDMWLLPHAPVGVLDADQAFYRDHGHNMHLMYTGLHGAEQCIALFDIFFDHYGHRIAGRERLQRLQNLAAIAIANYALRQAYQVFHEGNVQGCRELIKLAIRACPDTRSWDSWNRKMYPRLIWMSRMGPTAWSILRRLAFWRSSARRRVAVMGSTRTK